MLFDAPLQMKFHEASRQGRDYDMSQIFTGTLVEADPFHAVTLVANHDTQPLQALEAPVEPWFKPLAYALILLRENGVPSVFYPDLYGAHYEDTGGDGETYPIDMPIIEQLDELIRAPALCARGTDALLITPTVSLLAAAARTKIPAVWWYCQTAMTEKNHQSRHQLRQ